MNDLAPMWGAELCDAVIVHGQMESPMRPFGLAELAPPFLGICAQMVLRKKVRAENLLTLH